MSVKGKSYSINKLIAAIHEIGEGEPATYLDLLKASGIYHPNTLRLAIKDGTARGLIRYEQGRGKVASRYWVMP